MAEVIKIPKLMGSSNYDLWSIRSEALLIEKGYYEAMTQSISTANPDQLGLDKYNILKVSATKACAYIRLTLGDGPLLQTRGINDPTILWNTLKNLYEAKGFSSEFLSCKELINTTLSLYKGDMELYLHNMRRIVNTLQAKGLELPNKFIIALILNNLTPDYEYTVAIITQTIRTNNNIVLNIDDIFSQLLDESKRQKGYKKPLVISNEPKEAEMALNTNTSNKKTKKGSRVKQKCSFCGKPNHNEPNCWEKYPELAPKNWKSTNNTNNSTISTDNTNNSTNNINISTKNEEESVLVTHNVSSTIESSSIEWILDSGATIHTCINKDLFIKLLPTDMTIKWGNTNKRIKASGIGDISVIFDQTRQKAIIRDVLYIPELGINLLSLNVAVDKGFYFIYKNNIPCLYTSKDQLLVKGTIKNRLIILKSTLNKANSIVLNSTNTINNSTNSTNDLLWHQRLGHINNYALEKIKSNTLGANIINNPNVKDCEICIRSKLTSKISRNPSTKTTRYLEKIYIDIGGPIKPSTSSNYSYYITFLDSYTKYLEVTLLEDRKDIYLVIKRFIIKAENQSGLSVRVIHCDNEFKSTELVNYTTNKGIVITYAAPYTKEQNGAIERINRTLLNKVRALLITSNLPLIYWGEALVSATYLYNRTPHSSISYRTPYEVKNGKLPNISNIKVWGSLVYKKEPVQKLSKLDDRATPYYLIGYGSNQFKLLDINTSKVVFARDINIIENKFYKNPNNNEEFSKTSSIISDNIESDLSDSNSIYSNKDIDELALHLEDKVVESNNYRYIYNQLLESALITDINEPNSYKEVLIHPNKDKYLEAMQIELNNLSYNNTWDLVPRPSNIPILKGRWVLNKKYKADGTLYKYKARWVVKGYLQIYGVNYNETFASTTKPTTIRLLLYIATVLNYELYQWDIKQAFPNAPIDSTIYVEQPIGFNDKNKPNYVCKLNKALYGLKQSARQWQLFLTNILVKLGFKNCISDTAIFINEKEPIILAVHVDDILVFAKNKGLVDNLFSNLQSTKLEVSNLGELNEFLGIEINRDRAKKLITLTQKGYINRIISKYKKDLIRPKNNPLQLGTKLDKNLEMASKNDINTYQQQIGSLIYITIFTRPDLTYPVNLLARFMSNPSKDHFRALDIIWGYLVNTKDYTLNYSYNQLHNYRLIGYSDADWGGDLVTRKSTTGYIFLINNSPISWYSKLQKTPAISSCEAEYMAYKEAIKENIFINNILKELPSFIRDIFINTKVLYTDSQSAIELSKNPLYHARTKHIDITYHFTRNKIINNEIELKYCSTNILLADGLTKAISNPKWSDFIKGLGFSTGV
jgi:hypothetical protein